jgi:hypothetical protein
MPGWGEVFDDDTIWQLVNYLKHVIATGTSATAGHGDGQEDHLH